MPKLGALEKRLFSSCIGDNHKTGLQWKRKRAYLPVDVERAARCL